MQLSSGRLSRADLRADPLAWVALVVGVAWLALGCTSSAAPTQSAASGGPAAASTPAPLQTVRVAYSSLWGANAVPWTAYEAGIFAKHGLNAELSYISSAQTVPAALSGEVDVSLGGGYAAIASRL